MIKSALAISVFLSLTWSGFVAFFFNTNIVDVYIQSLRFDTSDAVQWTLFIIQFAPFAVLLIIAAQRIRQWASAH